MTDKKTISCIIPTCDRNDLLVESLHSVLNQTVKPDEIIIVNNGKTKILLTKDIRENCKIFEIMPYAGVAQARNFGVVNSSGDFLAFLDDDDLWSEKYIENIQKVINNTETKCVISRMDKMEKNNVTLLKNPHGQISIDNILVRNPGCGGPNVVIERDLFFEVGGYDPKLPPSEDKSLILEVLLKGVEVTTLPKNNIYVRIHDDERLTDFERLNEGIYQFTRKYRKLMSYEQYIFNVRKRMLNSYRSGSILSGIKYIFVTSYIKIYKLLREIF